MSELLPAQWLDCELTSVGRLAPVQWLDWPLMAELGLKVGLKREDILHPQLGGNKLYKLHAHLRAARAQGLDHILSFGGAWSNHIYALAAAGCSLGLRTTGVIRGERSPKLTAMLRDAENMGMRLRFISRQDYNLKHDSLFLAQLKRDFGPCHVVPEGGGDLLGAEGCMALGRALSVMRAEQPFDVVCCAVGTGSTLAGLAAGLPRNVTLCGFSVLKGEGSLISDVAGLVKALGRGADWHLEQDYHCGGYARCPDELAHFMHQFEAETGVTLDPVYTGKMMWGIARKARAGHWPARTRIVALHSGGLQGRRGFAGMTSIEPAV